MSNFLQYIKQVSGKEKYIVVFLLPVIFIFGFFIALHFESFEGGADNYIHYRVSRYAFQYPGLFLDHWGKPVFTLFSAPFAQFGFKGLLFFNVLSGVLASFFTYKIAEKLKLNNPWLAVVLTLSMPVYFIMMASAMTEVFFSFVLVLSVYFIISEKYLLSAILFSSLFLIRTEGYIFYPIIAFVFALKRQWHFIPFLVTIPLLYSIIGWFYFNDFLWLINQMPYGDTSELYGTGELLFFVKQYKLIFGKWTSVLIFFGGLIACWYFIRGFLKERKTDINIILIETLVLIYFAAHSYVWWSGTGASAGLIRVMAAIAPLASVSALRTIDFVAKNFPIKQVYNNILLIAFSVYLITLPFRTWPIPFKYGEREKTIAASVDWMKNNDRYANVKVYFYDPLIYFLLDRNPFDQSVIKELIDDHEFPEKATKPGELIFYDMQFGPNEGRLPLKNLMDNPHFLLVNYFEPLEPFTVLGGYNYAMLVFERVKNNNLNNQELLDKFKKAKQKKQFWRKIIANNKPVSSEEFTPLLEIKSADINNLISSQILSADLRYTFDGPLIQLDQLLVISIDKSGEAIAYKAEPLTFSETGKEMKLQCNAIVPSALNGDETVKIYIWNRSRNSGAVIKELNVFTINKTY